MSEYSKSPTNYSVDLTPEFKETVYAGCSNYFTLKVEKNGGKIVSSLKAEDPIILYRLFNDGHSD